VNPPIGHEIVLPDKCRCKHFLDAGLIDQCIRRRDTALLWFGHLRNQMSEPFARRIHGHRFGIGED
jgi:hypothetical protein